ncbi:MAG TPA: hypothetical protein VKV30_00850 [Candidatus Angelobacter sp.]|nr:hypothetical protein [Candidatus Angelobacter sp.]
MPEKNRSAGTTVIAILQIIGSALLLALAAFMAFAMIVATPPANDPRLPPMYFTMMRIVVPLFYAVPAVWGIVTAVGLLQLKNWARISTIVFSILLMLFGAFGILLSMVFFLKPPPTPGVEPKIFAIIGAFTAAFALAQIGIGIWWMIFFNRAGVKAQFLPQPFSYSYAGQGATPYAIDMPHSATPPPPSLTTAPGVATPTDVAPLPSPPIATPARAARPLSISIIAWFMLASCIFVPFGLFLHPPVILLATILSGWQAAVFILISTALNIYIGIALLKLKPAGRLLGIGYFIFGLVNVLVFCFAPDRSARMARLLDLEKSMFPWMPAQSNLFQADMMPFFFAGIIGGVAFCLVLVYFLAAAKPAFDKAAQQAG